MTEKTELPILLFPILLDGETDQLADLAQTESDRIGADAALRVAFDKAQESYATISKRSQKWWIDVYARHGIPEDMSIQTIEREGSVFLIPSGKPDAPKASIPEGIMKKIFDMIGSKKSGDVP